MGNAGIHTASAQQKSAGSELTSYSVISYAGSFLPQEFRALVFAKWLRSLRHSNDYFKLMDAGAYYSAYHGYVASILAKLDTRVRLAVLTDDRDVVLGFSVARGKVLDYVHVQKDQRKQGIGTALIPDGIETITHVTRFSLPIWGSKYGSWKFNPFA